MRWSDCTRSTALGLVFGAGLAFAGDPAPQRYGAPIAILQAAPFVELALPPSAYAYSMQAGLRDLRVVDARGERVPFALLAPAAAPSASERLREAALYPLPPRPVDGSAWRSPVDVTVEGDRISVHRAAPDGPNPVSGSSPGWLIDLGESRLGDASPRQLRLAWTGPVEFSVAYSLEASDDLRAWHGIPGGQLMSLRSATDTLTQPLVVLPERGGRFLRLVWLDRASAPSLSGATSVAPAPGVVVGDAAKELRFSPSAEPAGRAGNAAEARRALYFDLGGDLPLVDVDLRFASGTRVAPVRMQGRAGVDEAWRELGSGVFFRLERDGAVTESPAITMPAQVRFLRVLADERGAPLEAAATQLVVHARLASLVFATAGQPPFRLLAGSADASEGALPAATLVPRLDEERPRFGHAELGAFSEDQGVAQAAERAERVAHLRPWLLWAVLLVGVAVLAALVWRLARSGPVPKPPQA